MALSELKKAVSAKKWSKSPILIQIVKAETKIIKLSADWCHHVLDHREIPFDLEKSTQQLFQESILAEYVTLDDNRRRNRLRRAYHRNPEIFDDFDEPPKSKCIDAECIHPIYASAIEDLKSGMTQKAAAANNSVTPAALSRHLQDYHRSLLVKSYCKDRSELEQEQDICLDPKYQAAIRDMQQNYLTMPAAAKKYSLSYGGLKQHKKKFHKHIKGPSSCVNRTSSQVDEEICVDLKYQAAIMDMRDYGLSATDAAEKRNITRDSMYSHLHQHHKKLAKGGVSSCQSRTKLQQELDICLDPKYQQAIEDKQRGLKTAQILEKHPLNRREFDGHLRTYHSSKLRSQVSKCKWRTESEIKRDVCIDLKYQQAVKRLKLRHLRLHEVADFYSIRRQSLGKHISRYHKDLHAAMVERTRAAQTSPCDRRKKKDQCADNKYILAVEDIKNGMTVSGAARKHSIGLSALSGHLRRYHRELLPGVISPCQHRTVQQKREEICLDLNYGSSINDVMGGASIAQAARKNKVDNSGLSTHIKTYHQKLSPGRISNCNERNARQIARNTCRDPKYKKAIVDILEKGASISGAARKNNLKLSGLNNHYNRYHRSKPLRRIPKKDIEEFFQKQDCATTSEISNWWGISMGSTRRRLNKLVRQEKFFKPKKGTFCITRNRRNPDLPNRRKFTGPVPTTGIQLRRWLKKNNLRASELNRMLGKSGSYVNIQMAKWRERKQLSSALIGALDLLVKTGQVMKLPFSEQSCRKCGGRGHVRTTCAKEASQTPQDYPADYRVMVKYKSKTYMGKNYDVDKVSQIVKSGGGKGGNFVGSQIRNGIRYVQFIYDTKAQAAAAVTRIRNKAKKLGLPRTSVKLHIRKLPEYWSSWR
jgi:hypothetical protein